MLVDDPDDLAARLKETFGNVLGDTLLEVATPDAFAHVYIRKLAKGVGIDIR